MDNTDSFDWSIYASQPEFDSTDIEADIAAEWKRCQEGDQEDELSSFLAFGVCVCNTVVENFVLRC